MNRTILIAALKIIPHKMQQKAVCKALNYLFREQDGIAGSIKSIELVVTDLNASWNVCLSPTGFEPLNSKMEKPNIIVSAELNTILQCQNKTGLTQAINSGGIDLDSADHDSSQLEHMLLNIDAARLDSLVSACYRFLRMKRPQRFNLKTVTIDDVQTAEDVDYLRDEAMKLESTNLQLALRVMTIAQQARPGGIVIKQKIEEYQEQLKVR